MFTIGIDGGGSNLRVVVVDDALTILAQTTMVGTANPSVIGRDAAALLVQDAMRTVIAAAPDQPIVAVGIGIAGAAPAYAAHWLHEIVKAVLPNTLVVPATDVEMALVGAHGARRGVIVMAGTGSVAYGVSETGEGLQVGGWGYLLGDEGSGYWLGLKALQAVTMWSDSKIDVFYAVAHFVMQELQLSSPKEVIPWLYRTPPPTHEVAALASLMLMLAEEGNLYAKGAINEAAGYLAGMIARLKNRLALTDPPIAFGGGLLTNPDPLNYTNPLMRALRGRLDLEHYPETLYPPVIGAALLAQIRARGG